MDSVKIIKFFKTVFLSLVILALAIGSFSYFQATKPEKVPLEIKHKIWSVEVKLVKFEDKASVVSLFGKVESNNLVTTSSPVKGIIKKVAVQEGSYIKKGQLLVALSDEDLELPLKIAKAGLQESLAQKNITLLSGEANQKRLQQEEKVLKIRQTAVARNEKLLAKNLVSQADLDLSKEALVRQELQIVNARLLVADHQAKIAQVSANLSKEKISLQQAEINLVRGRVIAPFDGRVAEVKVSEGSSVASGAELLSFYAFDSLELRATIPFGQLKPAHDSLKTATPLLAKWQINDRTYELPLNRLSGLSNTRGIDAFFSLPATLKITRPGDLLEVFLVGKVHTNVFVLPFSALFGKDRIYLVEHGKLQVKQVQVLGNTWENGQSKAILRGEIPEGAKVMTTQLPNAVSGLKVSVSE